MAKLKQLAGPALLKEFQNQWNNYLILSKWMAKLFTYLDRYFLKFSNLDSTTLSALKFFKEMVFDKLKEPLVGSVLEEIRKWRDGDDVDWEALHFVIESFITIGITKNASIVRGTAGSGSYRWDGEQNLNEYDSLFEKRFIAETKEYYRVKC